MTSLIQETQGARSRGDLTLRPVKKSSAPTVSTVWYPYSHGPLPCRLVLKVLQVQICRTRSRNLLAPQLRTRPLLRTRKQHRTPCVCSGQPGAKRQVQTPPRSTN